MIERLLPTNFKALFSQLDTLTTDQLEDAMLIADNIKEMLSKQATQHSILNTSVETNAEELSRIMFNKFHTNRYDNLLSELRSISPSPIEPMRIDPTEL